MGSVWTGSAAVSVKLEERVRGDEMRFKCETLLVIDRDKVQPNPHRPHVGV